VTVKSPTRRLAQLESAAQYADCSVKTIRRMIARGDLTGYRMGKRLIRVDLNELDEALRPIPTTSGDAA
jgi:excisionase family DNA binding protein